MEKEEKARLLAKEETSRLLEKEETLLQEELTAEMAGEAFLAKSRGLCEDGAWHGLFCTPRVVMSAPAVSFVQWAFSLVATNCAGQWLSRIFRDRLLPLPAGGLCKPIVSSRQAG